MNRNTIGELEEMILLIVAVLNENAYGVSIREEFIRQTGRKINISSVHTTLDRLQQKGFLRSHEGGATAERGGRRKKFFKVTAEGFNVAKEIMEVRNSLYNQIPQLGTQGLNYV